MEFDLEPDCHMGSVDAQGPPARLWSAPGVKGDRLYIHSGDSLLEYLPPQFGTIRCDANRNVNYSAFPTFLIVGPRPIVFEETTEKEFSVGAELTHDFGSVLFEIRPWSEFPRIQSVNEVASRPVVLLTGCQIVKSQRESRRRDEFERTQGHDSVPGTFPEALLLDLKRRHSSQARIVMSDSGSSTSFFPLA